MPGDESMTEHNLTSCRGSCIHGCTSEVDIICYKWWREGRMKRDEENEERRNVACLHAHMMILIIITFPICPLKRSISQKA